MSPADLSRTSSGSRMRPSEAHGSTAVSARSRRTASSSTASSRSLAMRVPDVTIENSRAPARSAAFACATMSSAETSG